MLAVSTRSRRSTRTCARCCCPACWTRSRATPTGAATTSRCSRSRTPTTPSRARSCRASPGRSGPSCAAGWRRCLAARRRAGLVLPRQGRARVDPGGGRRHLPRGGDAGGLRPVPASGSQGLRAGAGGAGAGLRRRAAPGDGAALRLRRSRRLRRARPRSPVRAGWASRRGRCRCPSSRPLRQDISVVVPDEYPASSVVAAARDAGGELGSKVQRIRRLARRPRRSAPHGARWR